MPIANRGRGPNQSRRSFLALAGAGMALASTSYSDSPAAAVTGAAGDDPSTVIATADRFEGIDPAGNVSSSRGLTRAIAETPHGGRLILPAGTYALDTRLEVRGKSITLELGHAELRLVAGPGGVPPTGGLDIRGAYGRIHGVQSIARTSIAIDSRELRALALTLTEPPDYQPGDVLKLVADDAVPGARPGTGPTASRVGQFLVVHRVDGASVTVLLDDLLDTFSQNVRVARLEPFTCHVRGGTITTAIEGMEEWTAPSLLIRDLLCPTVSELSITRGTSQLIHVMSCYGYTIERSLLGFAPNEPARSRFGYGILDNSSAYGMIRGVTAHNVRHAYTDDTPRIPAGDPDLGAYGRTYKTTIVDSHCHSASGIAWDTHSASQGVDFIGCSASGSSPAGFGLRGRQHRVIDCEATGTREGLLIYTESAGTDSWGHQIDGLTLRNITQNALNVVMNSMESRKSSIRNLTVDGAPQLIYAKMVTLDMDSIAYTASSTVKDQGASTIFNACAIDGDQWSFDYRRTSSGTGLLGITASNGATVQVRTIGVRFGESASRFAYFARGSNVAPQSTLILPHIEFDRAPGSLGSGPVFNASGCDSRSVIGWFATHDEQGLSSTHLLWNTSVTTAEPHGANSISHTIARTREPIIFVAFDVEYHTTLFALRPGRFVGQQLQWMNVSTAKNLTARHGASSYNLTTNSGSDVVLRPGNRMRLLWTGRTWQQI